MVEQPAALVAELASRGGDVAALARLARADDKSLQTELKALGFGKLGERARLVTALKVEQLTLDVSDDADAAAPEASEGGSTMVMHGAVTDIFDDGGLLKTTLRAGDATAGTPPPLSRCKVRYVGSTLPDCTRFEAVVREFQMGEQQLPRGLEKCVATMRKGETCELICRSEYAYGSDGRPPDVPPGASVRYEVELIAWVAPKLDRLELSPSERMTEAARLKKDGTEFFSSGRWLEAQVAYHEASRLLVNELDDLRAPEGRTAEGQELLLACELNAALCALKREEWFAAESACTKAIGRLADPLGADREQNGKALFRRAKARIGRSDFEGARADAKAAHTLQPNSREVRELWEAIRVREAASTRSESEVYGRMTSKLVYREYNVGRRQLSANPRVYFELAVNGQALPDRVVFELFTQRAPRTCENFRALCTGERAVSGSGTRLHYLNSRIHRAMNVDDGPPEFMNENADGKSGRNFEVWKGLLVHGGDIVHGDGSGGESIYGEPFEDEISEMNFSQPGLLAMAGSMPMRDQASEERVHVPNRNTSQFFITTKERNHALGGCTILHLNGRHTIFGRVVEGMHTVQAINRLRNDPSCFHELKDMVEIVGCGELRSVQHEHEEREAARLAPEERKPRDGVSEESKAEQQEQVGTTAEGDSQAELEAPKRPPPLQPTEADLAIVSAEVDDD